MTRLLVAPDKFKGSLTALEVASALRAGAAPAGADVEVLPLADGGDGSVAAAVHAGFAARAVPVVDALGRPASAEVALRGEVAVVEVANTCGIAMLEEVDAATALHGSSAGLGHGVRRAVQLGAREVVLGLGGSASTDGGAGFLAALGARLLDDRGRPVVPGGRGLLDLARVDLSGLDLSGVRLVAASDVTAPLLGPAGAAPVFGPQKGAGPDEVALLEAGLARLHRVLAAAVGDDSFVSLPGAGSAGGIGYAAAVLGATIVSGATHFLDLLGFDDAVRGCDVVLTGEGAVDDQTLMGKLPAVVATRSGGRPVHLAVGRDALSPAARDRAPFASIHAVADLARADTAGDPDATRRALEQIGRRVACQRSAELVSGCP